MIFFSQLVDQTNLSTLLVYQVQSSVSTHYDCIRFRQKLPSGRGGGVRKYILAIKQNVPAFCFIRFRQFPLYLSIEFRHQFPVSRSDDKEKRGEQMRRWHRSVNQVQTTKKKGGSKWGDDIDQWIRIRRQRKKGGASEEMT